MTNRAIATRYAWQLLGRPYVWGGDDPVAGFDCSGMCVEILKAVGALPRSGDWNSKGLAISCNFTRVNNPREGCLVFFTNKSGGDNINHVEYCINEDIAIGASGGGSSTKTLEDAIKQNAFIKPRPIVSRPRRWGFVDPFL